MFMTLTYLWCRNFRICYHCCKARQNRLFKDFLWHLITIRRPVKSWKIGMVVLNGSFLPIFRNFWTSLFLRSVLSLCCGNWMMTCRHITVRCLPWVLMVINMVSYWPHWYYCVCCGHQIGLIYFIQYFQLVFLWNAFGRPTGVFRGRFTWYLNGILEFFICMVMTWFAVPMFI